MEPPLFFQDLGYAPPSFFSHPIAGQAALSDMDDGETDGDVQTTILIHNSKRS